MVSTALWRELTANVATPWLLKDKFLPSTCAVRNGSHGATRCSAKHEPEQDYCGLQTCTKMAPLDTPTNQFRFAVVICHVVHTRSHTPK